MTRAWRVVSGLLIQESSILLVRNRRRDGRVDWSPPGGVIDPGEDAIGALTREVTEETGFCVEGWEATPAWRCSVVAPDLKWTLSVEVYRATQWTGDCVIEDPDGIVDECAWVDAAAAARQMQAAWAPTREPLVEWLAGQHDPEYRYRLDGATHATSRCVRLGTD